MILPLVAAAILALTGKPATVQCAQLHDRLGETSLIQPYTITLLPPVCDALAGKRPEWLPTALMVITHEAVHLMHPFWRNEDQVDCYATSLYQVMAHLLGYPPSLAVQAKVAQRLIRRWNGEKPCS